MVKHKAADLHSLVADCFKSKGWLERRGFFHEPEQQRYAQDVAKWLVGETRQVALMEAETGIGKTLGYLVPLLLHLATTGKRGMLATHTVQLQKQILYDGDLELAEAYVEACGLVRPRVVQVIGAHHYLDPNRLMLQLDSLVGEDEQAPYLKALDVCIGQDGLVETFMGCIDQLPEGMTEQSIAIKSGGRTSHDNPRFYEHREKARDADLIITSHMVCIIDSAFSNMLAGSDGRPIEYIVLDEADAFEAAAQSFRSKKVWPSRISRLLGALDAHLTPTRRAEAGLIKSHVETLEGLIVSACPDLSKEASRACLLSSHRGIEKRIQLTRASISSLGDGVLQLLRRREGKFSDTERLHLEELEETLAFVKSFGEGSHHQGYAGVSRSPVRGIPALEIAHPKPAAVIGRRINPADGPEARLMLTSATLSDGVDGAFNSIKAALGIRFTLFEEGGHYRPKTFGDMRFVLADPGVPKPFTVTLDGVDESRKATLSPAWLDYVAAMVREAAQLGPLLVLTSSFEETRKLTQRLKDLPLVAHLPGESLAQKLAEFQTDKSVLISPSAWAGVSIRGAKGKQLFRNLVITRIPSAPPNPFSEKVVTRYRQDYNPDLGQEQITAWLWVSRQDKAIRKLRQGLGRLIRNRKDSGTVWIADPRFPRPIANDSSVGNYRRSIPARFLPKYESGSIFFKTSGCIPIKDLLVTHEPAEEGLEWL